MLEEGLGRRGARTLAGRAGRGALGRERFRRRGLVLDERQIDGLRRDMRFGSGRKRQIAQVIELVEIAVEEGLEQLKLVSIEVLVGGEVTSLHLTFSIHR